MTTTSRQAFNRLRAQRIGEYAPRSTPRVVSRPETVEWDLDLRGAPPGQRRPRWLATAAVAAGCAGLALGGSVLSTGRSSAPASTAGTATSTGTAPGPWQSSTHQLGPEPSPGWPGRQGNRYRSGSGSPSWWCAASGPNAGPRARPTLPHWPPRSANPPNRAPPAAACQAATTSRRSSWSSTTAVGGSGRRFPRRPAVGRSSRSGRRCAASGNRSAADGYEDGPASPFRVGAGAGLRLVRRPPPVLADVRTGGGHGPDRRCRGPRARRGAGLEVLVSAGAPDWRSSCPPRPRTVPVSIDAGGGSRHDHGVTFVDGVELVGKAVDGAGVAILVVGALAATVTALSRAASHHEDVYRRYRQQLGRSILLGLELLVAADIIRTVAVTPTVSSISLLAGVVLIRTFLSFSLELEITGRWPWQKPDPTSSSGVATPMAT